MLGESKEDDCSVFILFIQKWKTHDAHVCTHTLTTITLSDHIEENTHACTYRYENIQDFTRERKKKKGRQR